MSDDKCRGCDRLLLTKKCNPCGGNGWIPSTQGKCVCCWGSGNVCVHCGTGNS
jgi:hypothetical protein